MKALKNTGIALTGILLLVGLYNMLPHAEEVIQPTSSNPVSVKSSNPQSQFRDWLKTVDIDSTDAAVVDNGVEIAKERKAYIKQLIINNPQKALDESISYNEWTALPASVKKHVERPFSMTADIELIFGCGPDFVSKELVTVFDDGRYVTLFPTEGNRFNQSAQDMAITGIRMDDVAAIYNNYTQLQDPYSDRRITQTSHLPGGDNAHTFYVILIDFPDALGEPVDPTLLGDLINNDVSQQVYDMSNHLQWVDCTVDATTHTMPNNTAYYDTGQPGLNEMHDDAVTAAGISLDDYDTVCVIFNEIGSLGFAGLASTPGERMWINGYISAAGTSKVITHELGHNLGSFHASSWDVPSTDPVDAAGSSTEYGDTTDIMGGGVLPNGHFHVQNKLQVGWLDGTNLTDVTTSGTYRVYRSDNPETSLTVGAIRGLRIEKTGGPDYYWLGYRQLYDNLENFGRGLYILWQKTGELKSNLLDMTPGSEADNTDDKEDGGLKLGQTYSDNVAQVHITPVTRGGKEPDQYMDVVINLGDFAGNNAPGGSESWPTAGNARESIVFEVQASDTDGDTLAYSWDFGDGLIKPNSPIVSHAWAIGGSYTVSCTVTDMKGGTDTVSETVIVSDNLESAWLEQNSNTSSDLFDITEGNGTLVVVGHGGFVATSTDGASWTTRDLDINPTGNYFLTSVIYDGSHFVTVGFNFAGIIEGQPNLVGLVYTSPDGITWTLQHYGGKNLEDVAYHDGVYLAVGDASTVLKSVDRETWSSVVPGISGDFKSIVHSGTTFIAAGSSQVVMTSTDGNSWTRSMDVFYPNFYELENLNGRIFGGGYGNGIYETVNEGSSFDPLLEDTIEIGGFCFGNGIYFAVGSVPDNDPNASNVDLNFLSANGTGWLELTTAAQADRNAAIFFDNAIITVGASGSVWKSPTVQVTDDGYGSWELLNRSELGLNRDPEDDADCDGVKNILEYALGTDASDASSVPMISSSKDVSDRLVITIPRTRTALDVNHIVEESTGLDESAIWSTADQIIENETVIEYRTNNPISSVSPQFLRLRAEVVSPAP